MEFFQGLLEHLNFYIAPSDIQVIITHHFPYMLNVDIYKGSPKYRLQKLFRKKSLNVEEVLLQRVNCSNGIPDSVLTACVSTQSICGASEELP
jgi:hypothetical protein